RYCDESDIRRMLGGAPASRATVVSYRVSRAGQKTIGHRRSKPWKCTGRGAGLAVDEWAQAIGGGMHFKRQRFLDLLDRIQRGGIGKRLVAHP
ncbi:Transposon IS605 OrfA, integrase-resolvase, partial [mine drainage metagenome]